MTHIGQASLAAALLVALLGGLVLAWRWFEKNRATLIDRTQRLWRRFLETSGMRAFSARYPHVWTFVSARFARGEYLGLHLTVGLAVSLAGLWLFSAITEDVIHHDPLTQFDLALLTWLRGRATPTGYAVANTISLLGSPATVGVMALAVGALMAVRRRWIVLGGWAAAFAGGGILNLFLKARIHRPRPPYAADFLTDASWSFPSGHAMGSLIAYGMLAYVLLVVIGIPGRRAPIVVVVSAALVIVAVGLSRLYLGVHYFSDVVGGYAAGLLWLSACISGLESVRSRRAATNPQGG